MQQIKILIFIDWYYPAFKAGGPIQSISNFVACFKQKYNISIITSDRDLGDQGPFKDIPVCNWIDKDHYRVMYIDPSHQNTTFYKTLFKEKAYDVIYFNSLFSLSFTLKPLLIAKKNKLKIIVAPRGMLGNGALNIKPLKKKVFLALSKILGLYEGIIWHATAETEKQEVIKNFGANANIKVAPNLPSVRIELINNREKKRNELSLFFVSRIAQKKNLLESLKWLEGISKKIQLSFFIIGPIDEANFWMQCKEVIATLPDNIKTSYLGAIANRELVNYLTSYHFLYLPTLHENYGHAIVESLQCGCPVIISDRTPWRSLEEKGIGWDIPLNKPEKFVEVIEYCAAMDQEEYNIMSARTFEFAKKVTEDPTVLEANRRLFEF